MKKLILFYLIVSSGLCSCKTTEFLYQVISVNGMVYDFNNRPVSNYKISLGDKYVSLTDINGRFMLPQIPVGSYQLNGEKEGYEIYQGDVEINHQEQIIYLRIPSFEQLLELADDALGKNRINEAAAYLDRAQSIGLETVEYYFYGAVIKYRQDDILGAIETLEKAVKSGSADMYITIFLNDLREIYHERGF
jgi:tetratricopeptide (TPR) repeat protein